MTAGPQCLDRRGARCHRRRHHEPPRGRQHPPHRAGARAARRVESNLRVAAHPLRRHPRHRMRHHWGRLPHRPRANPRCALPYLDARPQIGESNRLSLLSSLIQSLCPQIGCEPAATLSLSHLLFLLSPAALLGSAPDGRRFDPLRSLRSSPSVRRSSSIRMALWRASASHSSADRAEPSSGSRQRSPSTSSLA